MTFESYIWLALTPLITLISAGVIALGWRKRSHLLGRFAAPRLLDQLTEKASLQRRLLKSALIVAATCAIGLALARPQFGVEWTEQKARGLDIVFALDSSKSMLATDLRPSRLERAKLAIIDLVDQLESDRIGLVAFAGQAFLQTPPTLDYGAFRESLNATDPSILSRGGSDLGRAIEEAANAFPSGDNVKIVILLTDGEDLGGQAIVTTGEVAKDGIQIYTIGIGTPEGEYLRIKNNQGIEEFVRDSNGQPVRSQLDESTLQQIAQLTGGSYSRLGGNALEQLYDSVLSALPREERESEMQEVAVERFQWLLAAAITLLVLEIIIRSRRPGITQASVLIFSLFAALPQPSEASPYNDGYAALQEGNYAKANERFTEALKESDDLKLQRDALYNMGHATYQLGREAYENGDIEGALKTIGQAEKLFDSALELDPNDPQFSEDAKRTKAVREAIEKIVEQQQQEEENQQQEGEKQNQEKPSESEDQNQQDKGDQDNQSQENQNQEDSQNQEQDSDSAEQNQASDGENQESSEQGQSSGEEENNQQADQQQQPGEQGEPRGDPNEDTQSDQTEASETENGQNQSTEEDKEAPEGASAEDQGNENEGEQMPVPQVGEPEAAASDQEPGGEGGTAANVAVEGMSIEEAQVLLDSLRSKEEILPFAKPVPGRGRPLKDW